MAIATGIPGLEVTVEVGATALPQYGYVPAEDVEVATSITNNPDGHAAGWQLYEANTPVTKEIADRLSPIGRIVLYFYFIEHLQAVKPVEVPQTANNEFDSLSEKALHKVAAAQGDESSHQTSFAAPVQHDTITCNELQTTDSELFASFAFLNRSTDALKSIGVIQRTPSPSPEPEPEDGGGDEDESKNPEDMTEEEMRAEFRRMRKKRQE
ncbi:hypothetical protein G6011_08666 [Alternaria panax]|uniref:DUF7918 domain-containing protein n=1 Tax=Alternaria panax TaxID=48097 RepID=A0AAD4FKE1_9PLEO|nr:hypothetical protein G6011_08666 [Alternaria panax]